jgi:hypothetical protein
VLLMYVIAGFLFELWLKYHRESLDTYNAGDGRLHKDIKNNTTDNTVLLTDLPMDSKDSFGSTHQGQTLVGCIRDTLERFESEGRRWEVNTHWLGGKEMPVIHLVYKLEEYDAKLERIYDYQQQLVKIFYESSSHIGMEQLKIDELCAKIKKDQESLEIELTNQEAGIIDSEFSGKAFVEFKHAQHAHDCYNRFCKTGFAYKVFGSRNYGSREELILDHGFGKKKRVFVEDQPGGEVNNQDKTKLTDKRGHFESLPIAIDINWEFFSNVSALQRRSKKAFSLLALGLVLCVIGAVFMGTAFGFGKVVNGGGSSKKVQS